MEPKTSLSRPKQPAAGPILSQ